MADKPKFEKQLPEWHEAGCEPPDFRKQKGFEPGYKPPAGYFNWFWNRVSEALAEIREKVEMYGVENEQEKKMHREHGTLDHPDQSVTDAKICERTVLTTRGELQSLLNRIGKMIQGIKGTAKWDDAPKIALDKAMDSEVYDPERRKRQCQTQTDELLKARNKIVPKAIHKVYRSAQNAEKLAGDHSHTEIESWLDRVMER